MKMKLQFAAGWLASLIFAGASHANTIIVTAPGCEPPVRTAVTPTTGLVEPLSFNCPTGLNYSGGGGETIGGVTHIHSLLAVSPPGGPHGPFEITSGPYTTTNGFALSTHLFGFASYQGDPGGSFSWTATLTGTYLGRVSTVTSTGVVTGSPQMVIDVSDFQNFPGISGTDFFVSSLTASTSGIGEVHLERTGVATLALVPEPDSYAMLLGGIGFLAFAARRRKRI